MIGIEKIAWAIWNGWYLQSTLNSRLTRPHASAKIDAKDSNSRQTWNSADHLGNHRDN
ncbi:hypothetical protein ABIA45_007391 [Bradyrhizobium sp. USDA 336]